MTDLRAVANVVEETADIVRHRSHDLSWQSTFDTRDELVGILDERAAALRAGDRSSVAEVRSWFLPTGPLCEIAASSGWLPEYTELGNRLDVLCAPATTTVSSSDRPLAMVFLYVQGLLVFLGYGLTQLSKLDDTYCSVRPGDGYADCGDPGWPDRAAMTSVIGGGLLIIVTAACIGWTIARGRRSLPVSICFLAVQVLLLCVTIWMAAQFGPA
ncbi:hypothetical protein nbrc107696_43140 [Gordonia spumicola]|uniref:Uncharacterized protein n=1 Tax=Gordonia spumicola TaxID=589161 RepID=A0A7I9VET2_9ACTN|nr:hypothetical protein [Gordonia spumicola]GEE03868.1 hypothetical protein nbrc107696_43140 [Gordonia spumicola]